MIRPPAVAGRFYPENATKLGELVDSLVATSNPDAKIRVRACLVPHAGYLYSGGVAGAVYGGIEIPEHIILIGPRHYPRGAAAAILSEGAWQTPLGLAQIDQSLAAKIMAVSPLLQEDAEAHGAEHSIEVQLPFLQRLAASFRFVPIVIGPVQFTDLEDLGKAIANVIAAEKESVLIVASSDMNHYESDAVTRTKDRMAVEHILALDARGLFDTVRNEDISMCGYGAAVVMLTAALQLDWMQGELIRYATSGEINGDMQEVVGYAGAVVF